MQQARGGMGSKKHGTSGTPGPNRRALRLLPLVVAAILSSPRRSPPPTYQSVRDLFRAERRHRARRG
jgi:hypothetical protein